MSFARVCVCELRRQQRLLSCICCWPTLFIYILFHFILFHFMLAFFLFFVTVVVAVSGWCYELFYIHFKYAAYVFSGRRFEYLHAIAMSILRHFHCDSVCVPQSVCVCVCHKLLSAYCRWCRVFQMRPSLECGGT